jgi:hypothetical protein
LEILHLAATLSGSRLIQLISEFMNNLKKQIEVNVMQKVYFEANVLAIGNDQKIGEKNDYYITLEQLMNVMTTIKNSQSE